MENKYVKKELTSHLIWGSEEVEDVQTEENQAA